MMDVVNLPDPAPADATTLPAATSVPAVEVEPTASAAVEPEAAARKRGGGTRSPNASRWNALRDGLHARILLPLQIAILADQRTARFKLEFKPTTSYQRWLVSQIGLFTVQLERAELILLVDTQRVIDSAGTRWHSDRDRYYRDIFNRLAKEPQRIARQLNSSIHGAAVLRESWDQLGGILQNTGKWTNAQRQHAFDLLGIPPALREGNRRLQTDADARAMGELVRSEMDRLQRAIDGELSEKDAAERAETAEGRPRILDEVTRRHRRDVAEIRRNLNRTIAHLREIQTMNRWCPQSGPPSPPVEPPAPATEPSAPTVGPPAPAAGPPAMPPPEPAPLPSSEPAPAEAHPQARRVTTAVPAPASADILTPVKACPTPEQLQRAREKQSRHDKRQHQKQSRKAGRHRHK
jgi:hypothetical protein